ncbi:MAG: plasmid pRiA4b ORF-3 family protein [Sediminibacterium sp.]
MPTYIFKIQIVGVDPPINRVVKVSSENSFYLFHHIIQILFGWKNYHLYQFVFNNYRIADSRLVDENLGKYNDCKAIMLEDLFTKIGDKAIYEYDFGDRWIHLIELVYIESGPVCELLPIIISGSNSCPPEDCGGISGYKELKMILMDPKHEEFESYWEWVGINFNPTKFSLKTTESEIRKLNKIINGYEKGFE